MLKITVSVGLEGDPGEILEKLTVLLQGMSTAPKQALGFQAPPPEPKLSVANHRELRISATPIGDLDLSVRTRNILLKNGLLTVSHLAEATEPKLLSFPGFGRGALHEVKAKLEKLGLELTPYDYDVEEE